MLRMRFPAVCLLSAALYGLAAAVPAHAQSAPTTTAVSARINDIEVAQEAETVSILVKLSQQPAAVTARISGEMLILEIDGLTLTPLALAPPSGSLVTKVDAASGKLTLSGAAFGSATTVIYRNAVLVEAKLAEPALRGGSSLMTGASAPPPAKSVEAPPSKPSNGISIAALAGISAVRCTTAAAELAKDAWALPAMGDHALCLLDADKQDEAKNRLDQLAAITPQDWRVALGRAALAEKSGYAVKAQAGYVSASLVAPTDTIRAAISGRIIVTPPLPDLQLRLPAADKH
jgi:hypothetical protein